MRTEPASIFDAHLALLADATMPADVRAGVTTGPGASAAWSDCLAAVEAQRAQLPDAYLRERAKDVQTVSTPS
jgi:phosphocarrier protein FPr